MKGQLSRTVLLTAFFVGIVVSHVGADVLTLAPSKTALFPDDQTGVTKAALQFDLSGMRTGNGREIIWAHLDWDLQGVSSSSRSEFYVHEITSTWDAAKAILGQETVSYSENHVSDAAIVARDYQRNGGRIRINLQSLATMWSNRASDNFGIVFVTGDLSRSTLSNQLQDVRLVVGYTFLRNP